MVVPETEKKVTYTLADKKRLRAKIAKQIADHEGRLSNLKLPKIKDKRYIVNITKTGKVQFVKRSALIDLDKDKLKPSFKKNRSRKGNYVFHNENNSLREPHVADKRIDSVRTMANIYDDVRALRSSFKGRKNVSAIELFKAKMSAKYKDVKTREVLLSGRVDYEIGLFGMNVKGRVTEVFPAYKSFVSQVPETMSDQDLADLFALKSYELYASTTISRRAGSRVIGIRSVRAAVKTMRRSAIGDIELFGKSFKSQIDDISELGLKSVKGTCVVDALYQCLSHHKTRVNKFTIQSQLEDVSGKTKGFTLMDILAFQSMYCTQLDVLVLDGFYRVICNSRRRDTCHPGYPFVFILNDNHVYPITDFTRVEQLFKKEEGRDVQNIVFNKAEVDTKFYDVPYVMINKANYKKACSGKLKETIYIVDNDSNDSTVSMLQLMIDTMVATGYKIEQFVRDESDVRAFVHPTSKATVINSTYFLLNKGICAKLFDHYKYFSFVFNNQSSAQIANALCNSVIGKLPESSYSTVTRDLFDRYEGRQLIQSTTCIFDVDFKSYQGVDISKAYSNALLNNTYDYCMYSVHDTFECVEDLDTKNVPVGEYLITAHELDCGITIPEGIYPYFLVQYLLDNGMSEHNVVLYVKPSASLSATTFKPVVEKAYELLESKEAKHLINVLSGRFGTKYQVTSRVCICDEYATVEGLRGLYPEMTCHIICSGSCELYYCEIKHKERNLYDNTSLLRHVRAFNVMQTLKMIKHVSTPKTHVLGVNTDAAFLSNIDDDLVFTREELSKLSPLDQIGKWCVEEVKPKDSYYERRFEISEPLNLLQRQRETMGEFIYGPAGSGKSTYLRKLIAEGTIKKEECLGLAIQNTIVNQLRAMGINARTFASFFNDNDNLWHIVKNFKYKYVVVDEVSMVSLHYLTLLYELCIKCNVTLYLVGDMYQLPPVEERMYTDLTKSGAILDLCRLKPMTTIHRYDEKLAEVCDGLLNNGEFKLTHKWTKKRMPHVNICKTNKTRIKVNKEVTDELAVKHGWKPMTFTYQGKQETYKVGDNCKVVCNVNIQDNTGQRIFNSEQGVMKVVSNDVHVTTDNSTFVFDKPTFVKSFTPAYCVTSYKVQGMTITDDVMIHDISRMSANSLYVAMSRVTSLSKLFTKGTAHVSRTFAFVPFSDTVALKPHRDPKYENTKIYKITEKGKSYVGMTVRSLQERLAEHVQAGKFSKDAKIELIIDACVFSKKEAEDVETFYINQVVSKEKKCINKRQVIPKLEPKVKVEKSIKVKQIQIRERNGSFYFRYCDAEGKRKECKRSYKNKCKDDVYQEVALQYKDIFKCSPPAKE